MILIKTLTIKRNDINIEIIDKNEKKPICSHQVCGDAAKYILKTYINGMPFVIPICPAHKEYLFQYLIMQHIIE